MEKKSLNQKFIEFLTPKRTEEVRPGLFIQKYGCDNVIVNLKKIQDKKFDEIKKPKYRKITPAVWKGKINWIITILGANPIRSTLIFILILFLAWSYNHDVSALVNFINQFKDNPELCYKFATSGQSINISNIGNFTLNFTVP